MRRIVAIGVVWLAVQSGCATRSRGEVQVIAQTGSTEVAAAPESVADAGSGRASGDRGATPLERRIFEDEQRAADVLVDGLGSEDRRIAAWAAVYIGRLGLKHDASKARKQLGWAPKISFGEMVAEMVAEDLKAAQRDDLVLRSGYNVCNHHE